MARTHNYLALVFVLSCIKVHAFIIGPNELNLTSDNSLINLTAMGLSKNNIAGIGQDGSGYTQVNIINDTIQMKGANFPNTNLTDKRIQIFEDANKSISKYLITNDSLVQVYSSNYAKQSTIEPFNTSFTIMAAVFGADQSQVFVYQHDCQIIQIQQGFPWIFTFTYKISKYKKNLLVEQFSTTQDQCYVYHDFDRMVYYKSELYISFSQTMQVYNAFDLSKVYAKPYNQYYQLYNTDVSAGDKYVANNANDTLNIIYRNNLTLKCAYQSGLSISAVKVLSSYTIFTTQKSVVQFDNDLCMVVDEISMPLNIGEYLIEFNYRLNRLVLFQPFGYTNSQLYLLEIDDKTQSYDNEQCQVGYEYIGGGVCKKGYVQPAVSQQHIILQQSGIKWDEINAISTAAIVVVSLSAACISIYVRVSQILTLKQQQISNKQWWDRICERRKQNASKQDSYDRKYTKNHK